MSHTYNIVIEQDSDGILVGSVAELPRCYTQAKTLDKLLSRMKEAIELYLEVEGEPEPMDFIGVQRLTVEA